MIVEEVGVCFVTCVEKDLNVCDGQCHGVQS